MPLLSFFRKHKSGTSSTPSKASHSPKSQGSELDYVLPELDSPSVSNGPAHFTNAFPQSAPAVPNFLPPIPTSTRPTVSSFEVLRPNPRSQKPPEPVAPREPSRPFPTRPPNVHDTSLLTTRSLPADLASSNPLVTLPKLSMPPDTRLDTGLATRRDSSDLYTMDDHSDALHALSPTSTFQSVSPTKSGLFSWARPRAKSSTKDAGTPVSPTGPPPPVPKARKKLQKTPPQRQEESFNLKSFRHINLSPCPSPINPGPNARSPSPLALSNEPLISPLDGRLRTDSFGSDSGLQKMTAGEFRQAQARRSTTNLTVPSTPITPGVISPGYRAPSPLGMSVETRTRGGDSGSANAATPERPPRTSRPLVVQQHKAATSPPRLAMNRSPAAHKVAASSSSEEEDDEEEEEDSEECGHDSTIRRKGFQSSGASAPSQNPPSLGRDRTITQRSASGGLCSSVSSLQPAGQTQPSSTSSVYRPPQRPSFPAPAPSSSASSSSGGARPRLPSTFQHPSGTRVPPRQHSAALSMDSTMSAPASTARNVNSPANPNMDSPRPRAVSGDPNIRQGNMTAYTRSRASVSAGALGAQGRGEGSDTDEDEGTEDEDDEGARRKKMMVERMRANAKGKEKEKARVMSDDDSEEDAPLARVFATKSRPESPMSVVSRGGGIMKTLPPSAPGSSVGHAVTRNSAMAQSYSAPTGVDARRVSGKDQQEQKLLPTRQSSSEGSTDASGSNLGRSRKRVIKPLVDLGAPSSLSPDHVSPRGPVAGSDSPGGRKVSPDRPKSPLRHYSSSPFPLVSMPSSQKQAPAQQQQPTRPAPTTIQPRAPIHIQTHQRNSSHSQSPAQAQSRGGYSQQQQQQSPLTQSPTSALGAPRPPFVFSAAHANDRRELRGSPASSTGDSSSGKMPLTPRDGSDASQLGASNASSIGGPGIRSRSEDRVRARGYGHEKRGSKGNVSFESKSEVEDEGEERRRTRRRNEARAAIEYGNALNGPPPVADSDEENEYIYAAMGGMPPGAMAGWAQMAALQQQQQQQQQQAFFPPMGMQMPDFSSTLLAQAQAQAQAQIQALAAAAAAQPGGAAALDPSFLAAHQQAMIIAKQTYQYAVAQHAMQAASEQWERSSSLSGFNVNMNMNMNMSMGGMGGMGAGGYGGMMMPSAPASMYGSVGGPLSMYAESSVGGWTNGGGAGSVYGDAFGSPQRGMPGGGRGHSRSVPFPRDEDEDEQELGETTVRRVAGKGSPRHRTRTGPSAAPKTQLQPQGPSARGGPLPPSSWRR
ncbi:hypothetical protein BOTBODRAFT_187051 [Botryobasidium botryosum FD-172 SS1]|uniref:Uncharacterized protein n=1 Tax=Botryobasidium botryosum (strain FD-172 SS1) TaxID=930990 RepID=A0A067MUM7_BOTB1|nr:hypothetical protein BOTBODRAFT_187051 [Botryobasidium botryosum FD-172 SS1]